MWKYLFDGYKNKADGKNFEHLKHISQQDKVFTFIDARKLIKIA